MLEEILPTKESRRRNRAMTTPARWSARAVRAEQLIRQQKEDSRIEPLKEWYPKVAAGRWTAEEHNNWNP